MRAITLAAFAAACTGSIASAQDFGPDPFGYFGNNIPNTFLDISVSGTDITGSLGPNLDDAGISVPLGFMFTFYGVDISSIGFSTNGYLADNGDLTDFTNDCPISTPITPDRGIYPFFDDLRLTEHGSMHTQLFGLAPNRVFIAQWEDVGTFDDSTASLTLQAALFEGDDSIEFHYQSMVDGTGPGFDASGGGATIGTEGASGSGNGLEIGCDDAGTVTGNVTAFRIEVGPTPPPPAPPAMYGSSVIAPNFSDISGVGTDITGSLGANLDDAGIVVPIGFSFNFFGSDINSIGFSTNGYLADDADLTDFTNDCPIATPDTPNTGIYPFFDDLRLTEHGQMFTFTAGAAPTRVFTAQWDNVGTFDDSTANLTFQAQLHEDCNAIEFHYFELTDGTGPGFDASGGGATVGVEGPGGTSGTAVSCDQSGAVTTANAFRLVIVGSQTPRFATVPNVGTFSADPAGGPTIGTNWAPSVSGALPAPALDFAIISTLNAIEAPTAFGTFLCPISVPLLEINLVPGSPFAIAIPPGCDTVGLGVCSQGGSASFGPLTLGLANGLDLIIGAP